MNRLVVNIKDDLTKLNLGKLGKVEWDILMAVLHIINRHADQGHKISLSEIKKLAGIRYDNSKYREAIETLQGHLDSLQMIDRQEGKIISKPFRLFDTFKTTNNTLTVKVSDDALYMFGTKYYGTPTGGFSNGNYIHIDLQDFLELKSKHDKYMYLVLTEWARTGTAQVDLDVFAHRIGQPEMKWNRLLGNVLQPAIDHLGGHYLVCDMGRKKSEWKDELGQLEINYYKIDRETGEILEPKNNEKPAEKPIEKPAKEEKQEPKIEEKHDNVIDITDYLDAPMEDEEYDMPAVSHEEIDKIEAYYAGIPMEDEYTVVEYDTPEIVLDRQYYIGSAMSVWDAISTPQTESIDDMMLAECIDDDDIDWYDAV